MMRSWIAQLVLALPVLECEMDQEDADIVELQLDDQALDAGVKVMEPLALDARRRQEGVALLAHDGQQVVDRALAVFALVRGVVPERVGDVLGLVDHPGTHRPDVHFDQTDDVRVFFLHEPGDAIEHLAAGAQVARARERQMKGRSDARGVTNVVDEESQSG